MNFHYVALGILGVLAATGAWLDWSQRRLPNWLSILTAVAGLVYALTAQQHGTSFITPAPWWSNLAHGAIALIVGMVLFAMRWFGGGDAKFYAGIAMWFPLGKAVGLLASVALSGLALLIVWFIVRRLAGKKMVASKGDDSGKFPYGLAISLGAVLAFI